MSEDFVPDLSGRINTVIGANLQPPSVCGMCGVGAYEVNKPFLDIKVDIEGFGVFYLCLDCGTEIGIASGCAPGKTYATVIDANKQLTKDNKEYESILDRLGDGLERDILDFLNRRGIDVPGISSPVSTGSDDNAPRDGIDDDFVYGSAEPDTDTTDGTNEQPDDNSESGESTDSVGPDDVSEPTSDDAATKPKYESKLDL